MARARLILDVRMHSKNADGLFPIALRLYHKKQKIVRLPFFTSREGWDDKNMIFKKSAIANREQNCDLINKELNEKLYSAKSIIDKLGKTINDISVNILTENIKESWDKMLDSDLKKNLSNEISLSEWGQVLIDRKLREGKPSTAKWYKDSIAAFVNFNNGVPIKLYHLNVTFLKEFELANKAKGNSNNGISSYMRGIRAIYNSAIKEDMYIPIKNPFNHYKIPTSRRTKKKALSKESIITIRNLKYKKGSNLWHSQNYLLCMFNCRGMNLIDLAKLRLKDIGESRIFYGRSKTGDPLSVKITGEFATILKYYTEGKKLDDFVFPIGYDGSVETFKKYKSDRRLVNKLFKIIAQDAGIEEKITSYYIRHSWATIAKNMGISTEIISEGLGHHSLKTTEIYLKSFDNSVLDDANELIVS
ncbi:tyrosine-type recombinase/integrase [Arenibacter algicola]|uniref:Site-specific tyrosine recombinase XerC n=1 Tax=Arenibacter algicola TaxID=616991 RepID=A0A221UYN4_9FLAO|nr:site-specific tyrosine recombinase XerC [Arenibacter algicola]|tara:strand:- start:604 stop:1857 length:1254 start_codon:yes stop_codon:yes gene_type:complete